MEELAENMNTLLDSDQIQDITSLIVAHDKTINLLTEAQRRKQCPVATGVLDYFPKSMMAIAQVSRVGNDQHNPGGPLRWDRSKSKDEADALIRHFLERGKLDSDGLRHSAKVAWRALALLEKELEQEERQ